MDRGLFPRSTTCPGAVWASSHFPPGGIREALLEAHHVVRPERLESDGSTARHVVVGCEERPADLAKLSAEKIRLGDPEHPHGQIGLAAENIEGGVGRDHLDPDGGKSLVQRREPLAEEANERVGRGQLNGALEPFVLSADAALERGAGGLHSLRRVRRRVAGRGEDEPLGNASDEARLERFLERGQTAAHRRVIDLKRAPISVPSRLSASRNRRSFQSTCSPPAMCALRVRAQGGCTIACHGSGRSRGKQ